MNLVGAAYYFLPEGGFSPLNKLRDKALALMFPAGVYLVDMQYKRLQIF